MWKKKTGIQLPKAEGSFYLDLKTLQTFKNSESVTIKRVTCGRGTFTVLKTSNKRSRMFLGTSVDVVKETFIHYERLDGKFEEIRLDHLCQVFRFYLYWFLLELKHFYGISFFSIFIALSHSEWLCCSRYN